MEVVEEEHVGGFIPDSIKQREVYKYQTDQEPLLLLLALLGTGRGRRVALLDGFGVAHQ